MSIVELVLKEIITGVMVFGPLAVVLWLVYVTRDNFDRKPIFFKGEWFRVRDNPQKSRCKCGVEWVSYAEHSLCHGDMPKTIETCGSCSGKREGA